MSGEAPPPAAAAPESGVLDVAGAPIAWRAWGPAGAPAVVLVHGGRANQHWWDPVRPGLDPRRRIVTYDLSGHGVSGHREHYDVATWGHELEAVIAEATRGRATVVAHSMGGRVALSAAPALGDRLEAMILLDVPVDLPDDPELHRRLRQPRKVYPSRAAAVAAFRVVPGTATRPDVARQVADASVTAVADGGWAFRGDPAVVGRIPNAPVIAGLAGLRAPVAVIRGADSPFLTELCLDRLPAGSDGPAPVIVLADAGHHLLLDEPAALAAAIEGLLGPPAPD